MTRRELFNIRRQWFIDNWDYELTHWSEFDFSILKYIMQIRHKGKKEEINVNDCIIMADTETSKKNPNIVGENHVVAWTCSLRAFNQNLFTLYGHRPDTCIECINRLMQSMNGNKTIIYFHNLSYDWVFLRKFFFQMFGVPEHQLNTKSHYPIYIEFGNGLVLKDSLILAQRNLEKWASDLGVEHQKAVGKWDYDKIRTQSELFSDDELEYIEHDTLAGVECIDAMMISLNKSIYSIPYTATGIPREESRKRGKEFKAHDMYVKQALDFQQQMIMECVYHGGYAHANRHYIDKLITDIVICYDFASSYPYCILSEKFPSEKFTSYHNCTIDEILKLGDTYAFMFKLILIKPILISNDEPMPALQFSKCIKTVNAVLDNGRILGAEYVEIYITELDLEVIFKQYRFTGSICTEVQYSMKDYLPRWFTDYTYELFKNKTLLKNGDKVAYALAKSKLNSLYGMCVQKPVKDNVMEDYQTGDYNTEVIDFEESYNKHVNSFNSILPYQWGVWVTAAAFRNLFRLGQCAGTWVYSDTDSCYGIDWDTAKLDEYNNECKQKLINNGYGAVLFNNREYWLGIAEFDASYTEFKVMGAKRYCGRSSDDGELHITVAGVPKKKGSKCLDDDINNFSPNFIFSGSKTGKKTHTYFYVDDIYTDSKGNITGDSIDLSDCDYLLDSVHTVDWDSLFTDITEVQVYNEDDL